MLVWFIAGGLGILAGILMPTSWFLLQHLQFLLQTGDVFTQKSPWLLAPLAAALIFAVQYMMNAFRTADSFTYFFSELHYNEGRRNFSVSWVHGLASFLMLLGGGVVGLEAVVFESVSAIGSRIAELARLPSMSIRTLTCCGLAGALAAMLELPTPAIFFVVEVLTGWSGLTSVIGPIALTSILAAGVSSSITGPVGFFHLLGGTDGGLALALRGASLELGHFQAFYAFVLVSIVAAIFAILTIWLFHHTDSVLANLLSRKKDQQTIYTSNAVRLLLWAVLTAFVIHFFPDASGLGMKLLQASMWEKLSFGAIAAVLSTRLLLSVISYCALGSVGLILPTLVFGGLVGSYVAALTTGFLGISTVHLALLMMGAYFAAVFGTPISATALVFSFAGGTSSENFVFLVSVVGANFLAHFLCGIFHKDRLATQGLYRHEIRFRNGMCFNTLSSITVRDAMVSWILPIQRQSSISAAYNSLMESRFLKLPVIDTEKNLVGMLSLADFYNLVVWRNLEQGSQVHELLGIEDIMKPASLRVATEMSLEEALVLMGDEEIVPVIDQKTNVFSGMLIKSDVINIYNKEVVKKASGRGKAYR